MSKRKLIIGGNWKMFKTPAEAVSAAKALKVKLVNIENVNVVICPPAIDIVPVQEILQESNIKLGGQNMYWETDGAFTGELSAGMLKDSGCEYVIVGHSERRHVFGETDNDVNKKVIKAITEGLKPIFCVGETQNERNSGNTEEVVGRQLRSGLENVEIADPQNLVIAYEPVWAIGTGVNATPAQTEEVHRFIRNILVDTFGGEAGNRICIQYGGSVKPANVAELLGKQNIDGALVGGASLEPDSFSSIIKIAEKI